MPNDTVSIIPIAALKDNYIWCIIHREKHRCAIVDPGDAKPVLAYLKAQQLKLCAILITHHHWDHTNGIDEILQSFPVPVYGPANDNIPQVNYPLQENMEIDLKALDLKLKILDIPGHTLGHIAYFSPGMVFTGDTLFAAGCGRLFEGSAAQLYASLNKLKQLPPTTKVYCGHEYTLANLNFAKTVEPQNQMILRQIEITQLQRQKNQPSLPTSLQLEQAVNPFLRCDQKDVSAAVSQMANTRLDDPIAVFTVLRQLKDQFKS